MKNATTAMVGMAHSSRAKSYEVRYVILDEEMY